MSENKPSFYDVVLTAVRRSSAAVLCTVALLFPAALLLRRGIVPESAMRWTAVLAAFLSAAGAGAVFRGKGGGSLWTLPVTAALLTLILLVIGSAMPGRPLKAGALGCTLAAYLAGFLLLSAIQINKTDRRRKRKRKKYTNRNQGV